MSRNPMDFCPPDSDEPQEWVMLCKRTNDPKLKWIEKQLAAAGVPSRRNGESAHAPILEVDKDAEDIALSILIPIDDIPDNDPRFRE